MGENYAKTADFDAVGRAVCADGWVSESRLDALLSEQIGDWFV